MANGLETIQQGMTFNTRIESDKGIIISDSEREKSQGRGYAARQSHLTVSSLTTSFVRKLKAVPLHHRSNVTAIDRPAGFRSGRAFLLSLI